MFYYKEKIVMDELIELPCTKNCWYEHSVPFRSLYALVPVGGTLLFLS